MRKKPKALIDIHNEYISQNNSGIDKMYKEIKFRYKNLIKEENFSIVKEKIYLY
ncbi:hypothetical protein [Clostridium sp.]|uniref:hypothetical protein n=1 Tax=Clostridium sp. TaxID=1506 RepID=UPI00260E2BBF|nr:hypothetical protein [Clostridium sp.]